MTTKERCQIDVADGGRWPSYHKCGRPVKGTLENGTPACGVHLRQEKQAAEREDEWARKNRKSKDNQAAGQRIIEVLERYCVNSGLDEKKCATVDFDPRELTYTEYVAVRRDVLEHMLQWRSL